MNRPCGRVIAPAVVMLLLAGGATAAASGPGRPGRPGAAGMGDDYFKHAGNGGYDVSHYDIALNYAGPKTGRVDMTATITARATQDLSSFNLDFRGPGIVGVAMDGRAAQYRRAGQELTIALPNGLTRGRTFTTVVRYAGKPVPIHNETLGTYGWVPTKDGAVAVGEPDGTPTWLPVNDHPSDKATYTFRITVPKGLRALANGRPGRTASLGETTSYEWSEQSPMASYLAMVAIGRFRVRQDMAGSIPVITAVDPKFGAAAENLRRVTVKTVQWASTVFGPYPFATAGGIIDDPKLDYALETQERPVYAGFAPDADFIVHELAHQWFGDSVTVRNWRDIWLNEGFATYTEWLWRERFTGDSTKKIFNRYRRQPAGSPIFVPPPGRPGPRGLFGFSVYVRGAMCLQALRDRVGDDAFFRILRTWVADRRDRNATTGQFVALAERISGRRLGRFFQAWLFAPRLPGRVK